jgi:hypothetical protein
MYVIYISICIYFSVAPPSLPQNLQVTKETMSSISLEWSEPLSDGGTPVTAYIVEIQSEKQEGFSKLALLDGDVHKYTSSKLDSDTAYVFRITAENQAGLSEALKLERPVKTKPKPPCKSVLIKYIPPISMYNCFHVFHNELCVGQLYKCLSMFEQFFNNLFKYLHYKRQNRQVPFSTDFMFKCFDLL